MKRNPFARLDVLLMLQRLGIQAKPVGDGRRLAGSCPSPEHEDRTASWFIRNNPGEPYHAAHKCQGCGFGGGPIMLASTLLQIGEEDAREFLMDITAPPPMPSRVELEVRTARGTKAFEMPACVRLGVPYPEWPEEHRAYLSKRNIIGAQVARWGLGFVPARARGVTHHRLNGRVVIPIRDRSGVVCSYTARTVVDHKIRYLEPMPEEGPARCVFGEQFWSSTSEGVFVVEGAFDALAVEATLAMDMVFLGSVRFSVAALRGSNPHPTSLNKLALFPNIYVLTDPDKAGEKARAILKAVGRHARVWTIELPAKQDPAKLYESREGQDYLADRIARALREAGS